MDIQCMYILRHGEKNCKKWKKHLTGFSAEGGSNGKNPGG
jgi:hypothetical protein